VATTCCQIDHSLLSLQARRVAGGGRWPDPAAFRRVGRSAPERLSRTLGVAVYPVCAIIAVSDSAAQISAHIRRLRTQLGKESWPEGLGRRAELVRR
jgi:hypothetical protein